MPRTDTPAASTMCGFSPTARRRRPKRVRYSSHHTSRHQRAGEVDRARCAKQTFAQHARPARAHASTRLCGPGNRPAAARSEDKAGVLPALREPGDAQHHRHARGNDVDGHTRDHLVAGVAHAGQAMQPGQRHRNAKGSSQRHRRSNRMAAPAAPAAKAANSILPSKPDVHHARALGKEPGQARTESAA